MNLASTYSVNNKLRQFFADSVFTVLNSVGSHFFDKEGMLMFLPLHVHVNRYSISKLLALNDIINIPVVRAAMDSTREKVLFVSIYSGKFTSLSIL